MVESRLEEDKNSSDREASSRESVPQINSSNEEVV